MKWVITYFTIGLFVVGLALPSISFAGDNAKSGAIHQKTPTIDNVSGNSKCVTVSTKDTHKPWQQFLKRFVLLKYSVLGAIIIEIPTIEPDGPCETNIAPWQKLGIRKYPDKEDHGWGDQN